MNEAQTGEAPRRKRLVAVGVFAFLIATIAIAPASLITPLLNASAANIQYQEVRGTIWNGEIRHVSTGDIYLGNLSFKLRPLALLTGGASADIKAQDGAAIGAGRISVNLISQRLSLSNVNAAFNLSAVRRYSLFGIPYQGRVEMRQTNLSLSGQVAIQRPARSGPMFSTVRRKPSSVRACYWRGRRHATTGGLC